MQKGRLYDLKGNELCEVEYTLTTSSTGTQYGTFHWLVGCKLEVQARLMLRLEDGTTVSIHITDSQGATFKITGG